jgi:hypothetical protein
MAIIKGAADIGPASSATVGYGTTTAVIVREVGSEVFMLDPSAAPFALLTDRAGSEGTDNPRFEWYEKSLRPKATQINNGGGYLTTDTTFTVDDGNVFRVNDVVSSPHGGDLMIVTGQTVSTVTVTRSAGGTTAAALVDNDDLFVVGSAVAEGADVGIPDEWQEVHKWNLAQIFRTAFGASRTRSGTKNYTGDTRSTLRAENGIMHAIDIERAYLFSGRSEAGSSPDTLRRTTNGFLAVATENVLDLSGATLSEPDMEGWLEDVFQHTASGDSRTLFSAPAVVSAIDLVGIDKLQIAVSDKTYGLAISQYKTSHGILNVVKHRLLENGAGGYGWGSYGLAVDLSRLKDRVFESTKLLVDRQSPGRDGWIDEYLTESGPQIKNAEVHGVIKNVGAAA